MYKELEDSQLIELHTVQQAITRQFKNDSRYGFDLPIDSFFLRVRNLNPQAFGLRVQAYFSELFSYETTPSSFDRGDFKNLEGEHIEFKCSFLDEIKTTINVKQIRPWQDLKFYYVFTVDFTEYDNIIYKCYKLSKKEMIMECTLMNAGSCHMTKSNSSQNEKVELGLSIKLNSENFKRWEENYLLKDFNLKKLSDRKMIELKARQQLEQELEILRLQVQTKDVLEIVESEKPIYYNGGILGFSIEGYLDTGFTRLIKEENPEPVLSDEQLKIIRSSTSQEVVATSSFLDINKEEEEKADYVKQKRQAKVEEYKQQDLENKHEFDIKRYKHLEPLYRVFFIESNDKYSESVQLEDYFSFIISEYKVTNFKVTEENYQSYISTVNGDPKYEAQIGDIVTLSVDLNSTEDYKYNKGQRYITRTWKKAL